MKTLNESMTHTRIRIQHRVTLQEVPKRGQPWDAMNDKKGATS